MSAPGRAPAQGRVFTALLGRGLRDNRLAPLVWGGSLGAMSALVVAIWPSIEDSIGELIANYPPELREVFGIADLDSVEKYVDAEMLSLVVPLAFAYFAVRAATRATVAAEEQGHLDTLLSLPVARWVLALATYCATGLVLAACLAVLFAMTYATGAVAGTGISATVLGAGVVNVWPLSMAFAGLAVLLAGITPNHAVVTGTATGTLLGMYVLDIVGRLSDPLEPARRLSAFRYYGSAVRQGLDPGHMALLVAVGAMLAVAGALLFERRDVRRL